MPDPSPGSPPATSTMFAPAMPRIANVRMYVWKACAVQPKLRLVVRAEAMKPAFSSRSSMPDVWWKPLRIAGVGLRLRVAEAEAECPRVLDGQEQEPLPDTRKSRSAWSTWTSQWNFTFFGFFGFFGGVVGIDQRQAREPIAVQYSIN